MKKTLVLVSIFFTFFQHAHGQLGQKKDVFTHDDTLRGSLNPDRTWWDVLRYDISVKPDYAGKTITGKVVLTFAILPQKALTGSLSTDNRQMQIDLQQPLMIDSVIHEQTDATLSKTMADHKQKLGYRKTGTNAYLISFAGIRKDSGRDSITIYYHGKPREAVRPPWDGGWIWKRDAQGRPWMSVACQGLGASVWYPCKDHQSDEPDNGASLSITVPDTLIAVGNGRLTSKTRNNDGTTVYTWAVVSPINNYDIIPYIGKYVNWSDTLSGENGKLDLNFWVLDYNLDKARHEFAQVKPMLRCFEYWFGPYPFYADGYKLVEAPHLGMEHQSAVAYGNGYQNGYHGTDLSGSGWGLKWDFIIVHESAHEWFGNNITSKDLADMWVHESFANYSETLYTECLFGKMAGNAYNYGTRKNILNDRTVIGYYGVNKEGSGDMYYKGGNMLQTIRHSINNDEKFRAILRGLNKTFYHQTVTTAQVEHYISEQSGINFGKVFDQYLRTTKIPQLQYSFTSNGKSLYYRWDNCVNGFALRLVITKGNKTMVLQPQQQWKCIRLTGDYKMLFDTTYLEKNYYLTTEETATTATSALVQ